METPNFRVLNYDEAMAAHKYFLKVYTRLNDKDPNNSETRYIGLLVRELQDLILTNFSEHISN